MFSPGPNSPWPTHRASVSRDEWATQNAKAPRNTLLTAISTLALLLTLPLHGQQTNPILETVDDHYNHLASLRSRYTEHYTGMGLNRSESGTLTLKKPGRMLWAYDSPAGKVFVLDGKFAWFYTPGDAQAQRIPAKQMDDLRTPLRFLLGHTQLKKELDNISITPDQTGFRIAGVPKGMQNRIKELSLHVTATGEITNMKVEELDGATTEFAFTDIHENIPTTPSDFIFTPPPGVTIVNGTPPI
jgi:outer membrane lipoprotein carrier protein